MKKILLLILLPLVSLFLLGTGILLFTSAGLELCVNAAERLVPGQFRVAAVKGRLADNFTLEDLHYRGNGATVSLGSLSLAWEPSALLRRRLLVRSVAVSGMELAVTETSSTDESPPGDAFSTLFPPVAVQIDKLAVDAAGILLPGEAETRRFDSIILEKSVMDADRIRFDRLLVSAPSSSVAFAGEVRSGEDLLARLRVDYILQPAGYGVFAGKGTLTGSLAELYVTADLRQPFPIRLRGTVTDPAGELRWQAVLQSEAAYLPAVNPSWPQFSFSAFRTGGSGTASSYSLRIDTVTEYKEYTNIHVQTDVEGDASALRLHNILLELAEGQLTGEGKLNWDRTFAWQADLTGKQITLPGINPAWPPFFLPEIALNGMGEQDRYSIQVTADAQHDAIRGIVQVETGITGDAGGLRLTDTVISRDESSLAGKVWLDWREIFSWRAEFTGNSLNPALFDPQWTGSLDTLFSTEGNVTEGKVQGHFNLVSMAGELRGHPVTARGNAEVNGENFTVDDFFLKTTGTEMSASGLVGETFALDFRISSSDLSVVWPESGGGLIIDGRLDGKRRQPGILAHLSGDRLSVSGNRINSLEGEIRADFSPEGRVAAAVNASQIDIGGRRMESLDIDVHGLVEDHILEIRAFGGEEIFNLQAKGGLAGEIWKGEIRRAEIDAGRYGTWHLHDPGTIAAAAGMLIMDDVCLTGENKARICINGRQNQAAGWLVNTDITSLPLNLIRNILAINTLPTLTGRVYGNLSLTGTGTGVESGELDLATENATLLIELAEDEHRELVWRENTLRADLTGNRLSVDMQSILRDGSAVAASFALGGFYPAALRTDKMGLQGTVSVNITELAPLAALTFPFVEPGGSLTGNFTLSGTAAHPLLAGQAELERGKMVVPKLGITVEDLMMQVKGNEKLVDLQVSGRSGGGSMQAEGELAIATGKADTLLLRIRGDQFEAVHLPELVLRVNPRLEMNLGRQGGEVRGTLRITDGIIAPTSLAGSITPSKDVVFVHADNSAVMDKWPFSAVITVTVDEQVKIDAFGLKGGIKGELQMTDVPGKIVTGTGSLDIVNGTFTIYGRELQIKQGQLLFSGGPVDNPGVSVRAENTTKEVTTGIAVSGFLREPEITFYSDPPMEENEIVSRLLMNTTLVGSSEQERGLLGSMAARTGLEPVTSTLLDFKQRLGVEDVRVETGKTSEDLSLVIGRWLTPSLYISYGKNLLKESGSFNTRYLLGHGFTVETETGATESGADLKYEIDL